MQKKEKTILILLTGVLASLSSLILLKSESCDCQKAKEGCTCRIPALKDLYEEYYDK